MEERRKKISCTKGMVGGVVSFSFRCRYCVKVSYVGTVLGLMAVDEKSSSEVASSWCYLGLQTHQHVLQTSSAYAIATG